MILLPGRQDAALLRQTVILMAPLATFPDLTSSYVLKAILPQSSLPAQVLPHTHTQRDTKGFFCQNCASVGYDTRRNSPISLRIAYLHEADRLARFIANVNCISMKCPIIRTKHGPQQ